jgi:L-lactate dehydrogenase complex protein LldE
MNVGLFIPCYVDQFYPHVAVATLHLLEAVGCTVHYPLNQTCCGQPMANSGYAHLTGGCNENFIHNFAHYDYVVSPSGSCTLHIKQHLKGEKGSDETAATAIRSRIYELTEFLTDVVKVTDLGALMPKRTASIRVGMHQSCHGQRGLHLSQMSELMAPPFSKPIQLLEQIEGIDLVKLDRPDECCGFGGTFCVTEEAVSAKMGKDRVADHLRQGVDYITGVDVSCLMHMEGILKRMHSPVRVKHIAELLTNTL